MTEITDQEIRTDRGKMVRRLLELQMISHVAELRLIMIHAKYAPDHNLQNEVIGMILDIKEKWPDTTFRSSANERE